MKADIVHALLVEDYQAETRLFFEHLREAPGGDRFDISHAPTLKKGLTHLEEHAVGLVFLDLGLPDSQGLETYEAVHRAQPRLPVIILSGARDEELAVRAVKAGAQDYLFKGEVTGNLIVRAARYAIARAKTENALRDSETLVRASELRYRRLFESAQDGILILNAETGMIMDVNPCIIEMLGFPHEHYTGRKIWELGLFKDVAASQDYFLELQRQEFIRHEDLSLETASGLKIDVEFVSNVYKVNNNIVIQCNLRNITERKQAEAALQASEQKFRDVFESANAGKSITLLSGEISVNRAFADMLGYDRDELRGKTWQDLTPPAEIDSILTKLTALINGEADATRFDKQYVHKNGSLVWGDVSVTIRRDAHGRPLHFITTVIDITKRKRTEEALRVSEERHRIFADLASDYIYVFRVDPHGRVSLEWMNEAFYRMTGYSVEEYRTQADTFTNIHPEDRAAAEENHGRVMAGEETVSETRIIIKNGETRWIRNYARPIRDENTGRIVAIYGAAKDVTERKQAEEALRESESRLKLFIEHAPASLAMFDRAMRYLAFSRRWQTDFHLGDRDLRGLSHYDVFPEIGEDLKRVHQRALAGEVIRSEEDCFIRADGMAQWLCWEARPWYITEGKIGGIVVFSEDITARKRAEEEVRNLSLFPAQNPSPVVRIGRDGRLLYANEAASEHLEWALEIGKQAPQALHDIIMETFVTKKILEKEIEQKNRVFLLNVVPIEDRDYVNLYGRDITPRKQAESKLRQLACRFETLLAAVPEIVMEVNAQKVYTWANQAGLDFFGADVIGREAAFYFEGEQTTYDDVQPLFDHSGDAVYVESFQRRRDGETRLLAWQCRSLRDENGAIIGALSSARDITDEKKLQLEILKLNAELEQRVEERTAQLKKANRELDAFAYSVSHDLRAPLRAIDGFTEILLEDYEASLDAEGKRICSVICENSRRMGRLIDDLLGFSRLGKSQLSRSRIDMKKAVKRAYEVAVPPDARQRLDFRVIDPPPAPGDLSMIRQVWVNLISNAVKFSSKRERGSVSVSGEIVENMAVYCVRDNGTGFDMRYAGKLFGVFQRLHGRTEFEGTGVGLAIVKRIVERHGGRVWAESAPDQGAAFYFSLPLKTYQAEGAPNG